MTFSRTAVSKRRVTAACIAAALIAVGILLRTLPLGLPRLVVKYGGSILWGVMLYWVIAALLPRLHPLRNGAVSVTIAILVELSRLYHTTGLDSFRSTMAGKLLLGKHFAVLNALAYCLGIGAALIVDRVHYWPELLTAPRKSHRRKRRRHSSV